MPQPTSQKSELLVILDALWNIQLIHSGKIKALEDKTENFGSLLNDLEIPDDLVKEGELKAFIDKLDSENPYKTPPFP